MSIVPVAGDPLLTELSLRFARITAQGKFGPPSENTQAHSTAIIAVDGRWATGKLEQAQALRWLHHVAMLRHPRLIRIFGVAANKQVYAQASDYHIAVVSEWAPGSLHSRLLDGRKKSRLAMRASGRGAGGGYRAHTVALDAQPQGRFVVRRAGSVARSVPATPGRAEFSAQTRAWVEPSVMTCLSSLAACRFASLAPRSFIWQQESHLRFARRRESILHSNSAVLRKTSFAGSMRSPPVLSHSQAADLGSCSQHAARCG